MEKLLELAFTILKEWLDSALLALTIYHYWVLTKETNVIIVTAFSSFQTLFLLKNVLKLFILIIFWVEIISEAVRVI